MKQGLNLDVTNEEYHSDRAFLSSSGLKKLLDEPEMFYRIYIKNEKLLKESEALKVGTAIHTKILEPEKFDKEIVFFESKRSGRIWEEFRARNADKLILGDLAQTQIIRMSESINKSLGKDYVTGGQSEVTVCSLIDGISVKVRADHIKGNFISDLKSMSGLITEQAFRRECERRHYDLSAALYMDVFNAEMLTQIQDFYFVVSSKDFDDTKVFRCTPELLEQGRWKYKEALRLYKHYSELNWNFSQTVIDLKPSTGYPSDNVLNTDW